MNRCDPHLPFDPNGNVAERIRLKYRYLDIRGDRLQRLVSQFFLEEIAVQ